MKTPTGPGQRRVQPSAPEHPVMTDLAVTPGSPHPQAESQQHSAATPAPIGPTQMESQQSSQRQQPSQQAASYSTHDDYSDDGYPDSSVEFTFIATSSVLIVLRSVIVWSVSGSIIDGPPAFSCFLLSFQCILPMVYAGFKIVHSGWKDMDTRGNRALVDVERAGGPVAAGTMTRKLRRRSELEQTIRTELLQLLLFIIIFSFILCGITMAGLMSWFPVREHAANLEGSRDLRVQQLSRPSRGVAQHSM